LNFPTAAAVDSAGNLYIADTDNNRIRKVSNGTITTVAGGGSSIGDNGPGTSAELNFPTAVAVDSAGNLYIADTDDNRIRKVSNGVISTVVGNGTAGCAANGSPAIGAELDFPESIAVDSAGNLYTSDRCATNSGYDVNEVSNGVITRLNLTGDGSGCQGAMAVDSAGNLYIADANNNRICKVSNGVITTVAGNGTAGYSGDGGPATSAELNSPRGIAVDSAGNLYIADYINESIRVVSGGVIKTLAGQPQTGNVGGFCSSPGSFAVSLQPYGVAVDSAGNVFTSGFLGYICKISKGSISAIGSQFNNPYGLTVDSSGNVYVADTGNNRVVRLTPDHSQSITFGPLSTVIFGVAPFTVTATASSGLAVSFASTTPAVCTVAGTTVTIVAAGNCSITASQPGNTIVSAAAPVTQGFSVTSNVPTITSGGVISAFAFGGFAAAAAGSWIEIYGSNLGPASGYTWQGSDFTGNNAPTLLQGVSLKINGVAAFLDYVSATQVNAQVPGGVGTGVAQLILTTSNGSSAAYQLMLNALEPGLLAPPSSLTPAFTVGGKQYVAAVNSDGSYTLPTTSTLGRPARPGETIVIYGIGFGPAAVPDGSQIAPGAIVTQANQLTSSMQMAFSGTNATLSYQGLAPSFVGLYQFNVVVPLSLPNSDTVPLMFSVGSNMGSQTLYTAVHN
jgi:uncharacterized protein (TIGR03437 family)